MVARLREILLLLLVLIVPTATASEPVIIESAAAGSIAATTPTTISEQELGSHVDSGRTKNDDRRNGSEPPRRYATPPVPLPVQTRAGQRQLKLLRGQSIATTTTFQQLQRRRRLGGDKEETEAPEPMEMTTKAPATNIPTTAPSPSPVEEEVVAATREPTPSPQTTSEPAEVTVSSTPAPNTVAAPTEAPATTQQPPVVVAVAAPTTEAPAATQPPVTPPLTFDNNVNVTTIALAPFTVQVQADAPEQDANAVYAIFRREVRKTLQTYLASALDYENLVLVQLRVDKKGRRRRGLQQQQQEQQALVEWEFRYTGEVVFRSVAPDRTDVLFRQRQALMEDSTSSARKAAVRNNDILKAGNVQIVSVLVANNNEETDKSVSDQEDEGLNMAIVGGIVAAAVVVVVALAILVCYRRRPPAVVSTANKNDKAKKSINNDKISFSPYGKENDDDDDDDEGRIISAIDLQASVTAESTSPKSYLQLSPSGALAKQPGVSSGDDDEDDRDNAAVAVGIAVPDSPDDEKDAYRYNDYAYHNNALAAATTTTTTTPSPHPRNLATTSLLGTGARLMGVGDPAPLHPMDEEIMMIRGAALNSISNDDSEKIIKQHPADQLYSAPILQVARSDDSSIDDYSLNSGLYGQSTANNKNAPAPTTTLLPSLLSPPPPPPPTKPSWMMSTPHQQQPQHHGDSDDGSEYTSDSESQFLHDKSLSNNKTALTSTPTLLPRALSVDSSEDDDSVLLSLRDRPPSNGTSKGADGASTHHLYPANGDQNSALRVRSVYSADFDEGNNSSAEQPNDSTVDDDELLRQAAFSPRVLAADSGKDDALGFKLMGTPATALLTPSPNASRITKGFDDRSDEDDDSYDYNDTVSDAPWDESKDELELSGGSDLAAQLDSLMRQADEMLAVPVAGLPRDGDQLVVPPSLRTTTTSQTAAKRTPGSVRRRGKPQAYGTA